MFICMSVCLFVLISVCMSVCLFVCKPVCLPVCMSVRLYVCLYVCLPVCISVRLSVCLSVCLFVCMSVCLSVCLIAVRIFMELVTLDAVTNLSTISTVEKTKNLRTFQLAASTYLAIYILGSRKCIEPKLKRKVRWAFCDLQTSNSLLL